MEKSIQSKKVTYDFARLMEGATQVSCSGFGQVMIDHMSASNSKPGLLYILTELAMTGFASVTIFAMAR